MPFKKRQIQQIRVRRGEDVVSTGGRTADYLFYRCNNRKIVNYESFPKWAKALGLDAVIRGIDLRLHADPEEYREVVAFIKEDPLSLGALVTTHKIDLYQACKDMFDYLDPFALKLGELSSISKKDGKLCGHAKDPISSGLALENFVPENYWKEHGGDVLLMGGGRFLAGHVPVPGTGKIWRKCAEKKSLYRIEAYRVCSLPKGS